MSELEDELLASLPSPPKKGSTIWGAMHKNGVRNSSEFRRVAALPRRVLDEKHADAGELLTEYLRADGGTFSLRPIQALALAEARTNGGLFGIIRVGGGKSLMAPLFSSVMENVKRPLIIVPVSLREVYRDNVLPLVKKHFRVHPGLRVITYTDLSVISGDGLLEQLEPDMIVCDEVHSLKHRGSGRSKRFLRYIKKNPHVQLVAMSGTITSKSLRDYWHILVHCLPKGCPIPFDWKEMENWANALDSQVQMGQRMAPGVLLQFAGEKDEPEEKGLLTPEQLDRERARRGFRRRLTETSGVVATSEKLLGTSLVIRSWMPKAPDEVKKAILMLRDTWQRPDGEEISEGTEFWAVARQLAAGFYYRWVWPNKEPNGVWLDARANWKRMCRQLIQANRRGWDTELAVANAIDSGDCDKGQEELAMWRAVRDDYKIVTEAVWLSKYALKAAVAWANESAGLVWYEHRAVGEELAIMGLPAFGAGKEAGVALEREDGLRSVAASLAAHQEGKNLQAFNRALYMGCPPSGKIFEQSLGRFHREGQLADEVVVDVMMHTQELRQSFEKANEDARYIEQTTGVPQKLLYASRIGC